MSVRIMDFLNQPVSLGLLRPRQSPPSITSSGSSRLESAGFFVLRDARTSSDRVELLVVGRSGVFLVFKPQRSLITRTVKPVVPSELCELTTRSILIQEELGIPRQFCRSVLLGGQSLKAFEGRSPFEFVHSANLVDYILSAPDVLRHDEVVQLAAVIWNRRSV